MKIKCNDGNVREFSICRPSALDSRYNESRCQGCRVFFGVHDTNILKPLWKKHVCAAITKAIKK